MWVQRVYKVLRLPISLCVVEAAAIMSPHTAYTLPLFIQMPISLSCYLASVLRSDVYSRNLLPQVCAHRSFSALPIKAGQPVAGH